MDGDASNSYASNRWMRGWNDHNQSQYIFHWSVHSILNILILRYGYFDRLKLESFMWTESFFERIIRGNCNCIFRNDQNNYQQFTLHCITAKLKISCNHDWIISFYLVGTKVYYKIQTRIALKIGKLLCSGVAQECNKLLKGVSNEYLQIHTIRK